MGEHELDGAPYRDAGRTIAERVEDLLGRMTIDEKVAQLTSVWLTLDPDAGEFAPSALSFGGSVAWSPEEALDHGVGQITRPLGSQPIDPVTGATMINDIQRRLLERTRLGIPAICHEECLTGLMAQGATSFPSPLNYASTWNPALIERVGDVIRRQMRSVGTHQGLAPVADVARDPRWGRVEETLGEDPYLVGCMVSSYVRGLQGGAPREDMRDGVIATLKHFCGYSFSEGGRNFAPSHIGRRELEDLFLLPFEMAVKDAGALSVMNSYQEIDGEAPAASHHLLTEVLRERWGFDGFTVADYGAVAFLQLFHRVASSSAEASALAVSAGLDVELPSPADFPEGIPDALAQGLLDPAAVDTAVRRVLGLKFRLGLFEDPFVAVDAVDLDRPDDQALAREVAHQSIILLQNTDDLLPLDAASLGRVAMIGPNAADVMALFGNYSFENHIVSTHFPNARDVIDASTVLDELVARLGPERVGHAEGCEIMSPDLAKVGAAVDLAAAADVAIVVVGDKAGHFQIGTVGEGTDTTDLSLPGGQAALVDAVVATGTPTVVVLLNGRPFGLADVRAAGAIVEAWFPGQGGAGAIVDVLLGAENPGGKTAVSFTRTAGAQPMTYNHKYLGGGFPRQKEFEFVFPFGHGLSYTTFAYTDFSLTDEVATDGDARASCTVRNTGDRAGDEVVQLYLHDQHASVTRPVKELKGFVRVSLAPGEAVRVAFTVPADLTAFTGLDLQRVVEPGDVKVMIGASSADVRLEGTCTLVGPARLVGEARALTSGVAVEPVRA